MADGVDVFDRAVGKKDSELHFETRRFSDCSIDCSLPLGSILRMDALHLFFPSGRALLWIEAIYAIPFLGQMQGDSSRYLPGPTPRMREPLRFRQVTLAPAQCFFRKVALGGVHHSPNKLDFAQLISFSMSHNMDMFDRPIRHHKAIFMLKIIPIPRCALNGLFHQGRVFQMIPPVETLHPKLPVWLNRCASDKYASLCCSFSSCSSKVWAAYRLSTPDVSRASPRTIKVAAAIPPVPSVEMLTAWDRSVGMPEGVKLAAAMPV